ncbi:hypothetical protein TRP8649_00118 [Pelagimonas phthalicica]|uniref:Uncharacterized protein n=1 Tax=Pelagimonas phthalicica TaxID=1037362 RepID=A0A238J850_9RHOB|nr:hypothetical protein CLV87_1955 [Pelagimonas phthalicica]SMX26046.1 hypothetical protein TRP8649_00118 [Pelagimonas phthalicica]
MSKESHSKKAMDAEQRLYRNIKRGGPPMKISRLLVKVLGIDEMYDVEFCNDCLVILASRDDIKVLGNMKNWHASEICKT